LFADFLEFLFEGGAERRKGVDHAEVDAAGGFPFLMFFGEASGVEEGNVEPIWIKFFAVAKVPRV